MPIYTFYPCRPDGSSTTFEAYELEDDGEVEFGDLQIDPSFDAYPTE